MRKNPIEKLLLQKWSFGFGSETVLSSLLNRRLVSKLWKKFNVIAGSGTEFLSVIGLWRISTAPSSDFSSEIG